MTRIFFFPCFQLVFFNSPSFLVIIRKCTITGYLKSRKSYLKMRNSFFTNSPDGGYPPCGEWVKTESNNRSLISNNRSLISNNRSSISNNRSSISNNRSSILNVRRSRKKATSRNLNVQIWDQACVSIPKKSIETQFFFLTKN